MSSEPSTRAERTAALLAELARVGAYSVLFSQAVGDRAGMNPTDVESLDFLLREGPMTAGRLAELTGLSTGGAITALIDRLERLAYVRREPDPADRRRVIVRALPENFPPDLESLYMPLEAAMNELLAHYSDEEIALLLGFTVRTNEVMQQQNARIRKQG